MQQIVDLLLQLPEGARLQIRAPVVRGRKGEHRKVLESIRKDGFVRIRINGELHEVTDEFNLDKNKKHTIEIVVDRIVIRPNITTRLTDSVETALRYGSGVVVADVIGREELLFSENFACPDCGVSMEELTPRMFSFNSPYGACPSCDGLGRKLELDPDLLIDWELSINTGALIPWRDSKSQWLAAILAAVCTEHGIDPDQPVKDLPQEKMELLLNGTAGPVRFEYTNREGRRRIYEAAYEGLIPFLNRRYRESTSEWVRQEMEQYMSERECAACRGKRLRPEVLGVTVGGLNIMEVSALPVSDILAFFDKLELPPREQLIARQVLKEIKERLNFLNNVGLGYLTLDRGASTLSGGESQRIRLATQIGSSLMGVLYILDEPSIGLHQRDNKKLLDAQALGI